jgi:molybdopterin synthase catalytic subunit
MRTRVTPAPLDASAVFAAFQAENREAGAIASFLGQVRPGVEALDLQIYDGFTQRQVEAGLAPIADAVDAFRAIHRYGRLAPSETIVVVIAAADHRRAAFEAVNRAMDWLKTKAALSGRPNALSALACPRLNHRCEFGQRVCIQPRR